MAYNGHTGVKYKRYKEHDGEDLDPECVVDDSGAVLNELYFESYSGNLCVTVDTGDEYVSVEIPVKADKKWNEFADSLPRWDTEE